MLQGSTSENRKAFPDLTYGWCRTFLMQCKNADCGRYEGRKSHILPWESKGEVLLELLCQPYRLLPFPLNTHTSRRPQKQVLWPSIGWIIWSYLKIWIVRNIYYEAIFCSLKPTGLTSCCLLSSLAAQPSLLLEAGTLVLQHCPDPGRRAVHVMRATFQPSFPFDSLVQTHEFALKWIWSQACRCLQQSPQQSTK